MDTQEILVDNFRTTLGQLQRYAAWSLGSAASFFILAWAQNDSATTPIPLSGGLVSVDRDAGMGLAFAAFWVVGALASYSAENARAVVHEIRRLSASPDLIDALRLYPSVLNGRRIVRLLAVLVPYAAILGGLAFLSHEEGAWNIMTLALPAGIPTFALLGETFRRFTDPLPVGPEA